jgi:hypothetical protein
MTGRAASIARRRALSAGKGALLAAPANHSTAAPVATAPYSASGRELARARRAALSLHGRAAVARPQAGATLQQPSQPAPSAAQTASPSTDGKAHVTGLQTEGRAAVTGNVRAERLEAPAIAKVGFARTAGGLVVSGTLVRSAIAITGDEAGASVAITGEADQTSRDDLTQRSDGGAVRVPAPALPHGASALTGRSGGRARNDDSGAELTTGGLPVTGSAVGRSARVTGDEDGAYRAVTGDQYAGNAERALSSVASVAVAATRGGRRVSGLDVEANPRVTGGDRGIAAAVTGSQYAGRSVARNGAVSVPSVTGDVPVHDDAVTGTARGAGRAVTGTAYYAQPQDVAPAPADRVADLDARFSVTSPQRAAQLRAAAAHKPQQITGAFAVGGDKVTGTREFVFQPRPTTGDSAARFSVTGEGRSRNGRMTGDSWAQHGAVTGTEAAFAAGRNPSVRAGKPQAFAGARRFKSMADVEPPKQLVTGTFGFSSTEGARVTLSGGAQG